MWKSAPTQYTAQDTVPGTSQHRIQDTAQHTRSQLRALQVGKSSSKSSATAAEEKAAADKAAGEKAAARAAEEAAEENAANASEEKAAEEKAAKVTTSL